MGRRLRIWYFGARQQGARGAAIRQLFQGGYQMHFTERVAGELVILDATGALTSGEGDRLFKERMLSLARRGRTKVVLNLGGVTHLDSTGIGELVTHYTMLKRAGGTLALLNPTKRVHDVLAMTRLLTVFDMYASEDDVWNDQIQG